MASTISIASLHPFEPIPPDTAVRAEISLLWPYSSSHASCALLLVDPDFRRRYEHGEIRVRFEGAAAQRLAGARIGIGDLIRLELQGARWRDLDDKAKLLTPGKPVEAELLFDKTLHLTVLEDSSGSLDGRVIHFDGMSATSIPVKMAEGVPTTPAPMRTGLGPVGIRSPTAGNYSSPALLKRIRISQEHFLNSPGLTSTGDSSDDAGARKRRRVSGSNVSRWTLLKTLPTVDGDEGDEGDEGDADADKVDSVPPPSQNGITKSSDMSRGESLEEAAEEAQSRDADQLEDGLEAIETGTRMAPPPLPHLQMPPSQYMAEATSTESGPRTPTILPVPAASLPIPSPFPQTPLLPEESATLINGESASSALSHTHSSSSYFDLKIASNDDHVDANLSSPTSRGPSLALPSEDIDDRSEEAVVTFQPTVEPDTIETGSETAHSEMAAREHPWLPPERVDNIEQISSGLGTPAPFEEFVSLDPRQYDPAVRDEDLSSDEGENLNLSVRSTPSDDQSDELDRQREDRFDLQMATSRSLSRVPSPPVAASSDPNPEEVVPSKLPVWNDHHPYGLDGTSASKIAGYAADGLAEDKPVAGDEGDDHSSQDEDAAWRAMDQAMHEMDANSHEKHQAPKLPLASVCGPEPGTDENSQPIRNGQDEVVDVLVNGERSGSELMAQNDEPVRETREQDSIVALPISQSVDDQDTNTVDLVPAKVLEQLEATEEKQDDAVLRPSQSVDPQHIAGTADDNDARIPDEKIDSAQEMHENGLKSATEAEGPETDSTKAVPEESAAVDVVPSESTFDAKVQPEGAIKVISSHLEPAKEDSESAIPSTAPAIQGGKAKRRPASRLSLVPDSVDTWFGSKDTADNEARRKTIHANEVSKPQYESQDAASSEIRRKLRPRKTNPSSPPLSKKSLSRGTSTELTYLTPIHNIDRYINVASAKVDVLAIVTSAASDPVRAKSGPRDWYTILRIAAPNSERQQAASSDVHDVESPAIRVEVFRPWKASLPAAAVGDVILLRNFTVRSRERRAFLLSGEESAWCAWRFGLGEGVTPVIEIKGPPVETGEEENRLALELREWWESEVTSGRKWKGKNRATL